MGLLERLGAHLPYARRYARSVAGDQKRGDVFVRTALERLAAGEVSLAPGLTPRVALYKAISDLFDEDLSGLPRLGRIPARARRAFLLTSLEGFDPKETGQILGASSDEVVALLAEAQAEIDAELSTDVLIIEDEPVIAADIEATVRQLGHRVLSVAATRDEAVSVARRWKLELGLVLVDIQLADGSSGIDAVKDILTLVDVPVIFITAFPERLLTGERPEPTFLITKPFQDQTLKAAIGQALLYHPGRGGVLAEPVPGSLPETTPAVPELDPRDLAPKLAPVTPILIEDRLALDAETGPSSRTPLDRMEALRIEHHQTSLRLTVAVEGSNAGPAVRARFASVTRSLARPLTNVSSLLLAEQTRGLRTVLPAAKEELLTGAYLDVVAFVDALERFTLQFPEWLAFLGEAQSAEPLSPDGEAALTALSNQLEALPDDLATPAVKDALREVRTTREGAQDPVLDHAFARTVGNAIRAIGRVLNDRMRGISAATWKELDKQIGKRLASMAAFVFTGASGAALLVLARAYGVDFGWVGPLVRFLRAFVGAE